MAPVQVSNGDNLSSNKVVESVDRAGVNETVSHPETRLYHFLNLAQDLQRGSDLLFQIKVNIKIYSLNKIPDCIVNDSLDHSFSVYS